MTRAPAAVLLALSTWALIVPAGQSLLHPFPAGAGPDAAPLPLPAVAGPCDAPGALPGEAALPVEERALLAVARTLSLDVKLGQLLMPGFVGTEPDAGLLERFQRGRVGGVFLLGRNVRDAAQVQELTAYLAKAAAAGSGGILPFIGVDFEGGTVNALRAATGNTPSAAALASGGAASVQATGARDAETLRRLGFNVNFAPVADVLATPKGVIGSRAFSSDPNAAAALSRAYLRGVQSGGVLGVMKHFPGHGATEGDSHVLLPTVERSLAELEAADLVPYRQAIAAGELKAVMMGHLLVPAIDQEQPTSLSPAAVTGLLRERLGFDGLVITDEIKMGAISGKHSVAQAALRAIQAGVDVILGDYTGADQDAVLGELRRACRTGELATGRLERSVARVLRTKLSLGLAGPQIAAAFQEQVARLGAAAAAVPDQAIPPRPGVPDPGGVLLPGRPASAPGRLYAEALGGGPFGYTLTDDDGYGFLRGYLDLGGPPELGYPISQRFALDGRPAQLTQRALLVADAPARAEGAEAAAGEGAPQAAASSGSAGAGPASATPGRQDGGQVTGVHLGDIFELFEHAGALLGWPACGGTVSAGSAPGATGVPVQAGAAAEHPTPADNPGHESESAETGAGQGSCSLGWWLAPKGVPAAITEDGAPPGDYRRGVAIRLSWLENDAIRDAFLAPPPGSGRRGTRAPWPGAEALEAGLEGTPDEQIPWLAIQQYGLPMSRPERFGPFMAQRFQRAVLQLWLDGVPGMPAPGTVVVIAAGELFREAGLVPAAALAPVTLQGEPGEAPALPAPPVPPVPSVPSVPAEAVSPPAADPGASSAVPAPPASAGPNVASTATPVSPQPTPTRQPLSSATLSPATQSPATQSPATLSPATPANATLPLATRSPAMPPSATPTAPPTSR